MTTGEQILEIVKAIEKHIEDVRVSLDVLQANKPKATQPESPKFKALSMLEERLSRLKGKTGETKLSTVVDSLGVTDVTNLNQENGKFWRGVKEDLVSEILTHLGMEVKDGIVKLGPAE